MAAAPFQKMRISVPLFYHKKGRLKRVFLGKADFDKMLE